MGTCRNLFRRKAIPAYCMLSRSVMVAVVCLAATAAPLPAQVLGKAELREKLDDLTLRGRWYYDDLEAARQEARRTGKPLFVLLRCPP